MFDVGFAELFLLSLIGLLVLGPERLPAVARTVGGFVRKARISYHNLKRTVEAELAAADAANPIKEAKEELESVQREVKALGDKLSEDHTPSLTPTAADPVRPEQEHSISGAAPDAASDAAEGIAAPVAKNAPVQDERQDERPEPDPKAARPETTGDDEATGGAETAGDTEAAPKSP